MTARSTILRLGKCTVCVSSADEDLLFSLEKLFVPGGGAAETSMRQSVAALDLDNPQIAFAACPGAAPHEPVGLDKLTAPVQMDLPLAVLLVTELAFRHHGDCLWIDAAVLVSPTKSSVLLAGASMSGKTTLSTALVALRNWKIVSEDISFLDLSTGEVVSFICPLSLRQGTKERLMKVGVRGGLDIPLLSDEWLFNREMFYGAALKLPITYSLLLRQVDPESPGPVSLRELMASQMLQSLLPISNAVRLPQSMPALSGVLSASSNYLLEGGNIADRVQAVESLAGTGCDVS